MSNSGLYPSVPPMDHGEAPPTYDQAMEEAMSTLPPAAPMGATPGAEGGFNLEAPGGPPSGPPRLDGPLTFVNFTEGPFNSLLQQANDWLQRHTEYKMVSCETVELPRDNDGTSYGTAGNITDVSTFYIRVASNVQFIRIFRLWVVPRPPGIPEKPQQITYVDMVPKRKVQRASLFGRDKVEYESIQDTIMRYNQQLKTEPLPGKIINIQTLEIRFRDKHHPGFDRFNENYFTWVREKGDSPDYFHLTYLRIFHETAMSTPSIGATLQIGYKDFIPKHPESSNSTKDFEPLSQPACRIQNWINENQDKAVINIQTVEYKFNKNPNSKFEAETHRSLFKDNDTGNIRYLKYLRVYFQHYLHPAAAAVAASSGSMMQPLTLTYKTFCPARTARETKTEPPMFENVRDTWARSATWLRVTGVQVLGAETVSLRAYPGKSVYTGDADFSYTDNRGSDWNEMWLLVHRVYINGNFTEPPANLLPPLPRLPPEESSSCTIL